MPNSKHNRGHRVVHEDAHNNNFLNGNHAGVNNPRDRVEHQHHHEEENGAARFQTCCVPLGCSDDPIDPSDPYDAVRVICNNEACTYGNWMHKDCFIEWEQSVLSFLRSCGRARSWSEKQRLQNLWTKKGYDLAYKACDCKCGRGHIRKDLDYIPPPLNDNHKKARKNKKKNDKPMPVVSTNHKSGLNSNGGTNHHHMNNQPAPLTAPPSQVDNHQHHNHTMAMVDNTRKKSDPKPALPTTSTKRRGSDNTINNNTTVPANTTTQTNKGTRGRKNSSSTSESETLDNRGSFTQGSTSTPPQLQIKSNPGSQQPAPPPVAVAYALSSPAGFTPAERARTNSMSSTGSVCSQTSSSGSLPSSAGSASPLSSSPTSGNVFFTKLSASKPNITDQQPPENGSGSEQDTHRLLLQQTNHLVNTTSNSMFRRRQDLSAFSALPRTKQNPYNIHMEETAQEEDDSTRNFVLGSLSTKHVTGLRCVLCKLQLPVFDSFPLLDGTLFLSPQAYDLAVVQVIWEGRIQFLNAVCLGCLQGCHTRCASCYSPWDGRALVVGTMYTYDVFAATPCCQKRLTCKHCRRAVVDVSRGLTYYSQYSRMILCPFCKANDYHFIRPLQETFSLQDTTGSICGGN